MSADPTLLDRPPWSALTTTHAPFALSNGPARRYRPEFAPMAAIRDDSQESLQALRELMKPGDIVGLFGADPVVATEGLELILSKGLEQMIYDAKEPPAGGEYETLTPADVPEMMQLAKLTEPGPFAVRTIELGSFIGIRGHGRLAAMAGERMRFDGFTEVSAVCTHPDYRGRGYASSLVRTLMRNILSRGETPFLHIFSDNAAAASLYKHLGFAYRRSLTVTVLKRADELKAC
jgi:predicted GNAT family acetyltransferase